MGVVAVIPARGGSKGIPRKNLVRVSGKPLISYSIEAAQRAPSISRFIVSTDDPEIAEASMQLGAEVPFLRPQQLSCDSAPMLGVMQHALSWFQSQGERVEAVVLLQPTSPLRLSKHIEEALVVFRSNEASSVVSVVEVPHQYNPVSVMKVGRSGILSPFLDGVRLPTRRQDKPLVYARNGPAVLVCRPEVLQAGELYGGFCFPYPMSDEDSLDIDTSIDIVRAEKILNSRIR